MQRQKQSHRIKQYILKNFLFSNDDSAIGDQDSLVRGGILDSTGIYELIMFIEEEFKFTIAPEEMTPDNFDTLELIDAFIDRKLA
ncbi:MAG: acyl carrier protein [Lysobacteraceae bacterium]|jgi:acyl carrier protein